LSFCFAPHRGPNPSSGVFTPVNNKTNTLGGHRLEKTPWANRPPSVSFEIFLPLGKGFGANPGVWGWRLCFPTVCGELFSVLIFHTKKNCLFFFFRFFLDPLMPRVVGGLFFFHLFPPQVFSPPVPPLGSPHPRVGFSPPPWVVGTRGGVCGLFFFLFWGFGFFFFFGMGGVKSQKCSFPPPCFPHRGLGVEPFFSCLFPFPLVPFGLVVFFFFGGGEPFFF